MPLSRLLLLSIELPGHDCLLRVSLLLLIDELPVTSLDISHPPRNTFPLLIIMDLPIINEEELPAMKASNDVILDPDRVER